MLRHAFMRRCLELASLGRWNVGNGALVGAVLVRGDTIIAEGYHSHFGGPHAERMLLENYQGTIEPDDVLYVNLEPCCHTGKTPPCTDIIIERGVKHVVYGMLDSDHRVAGKGSEVLRSKGVTVEGPFLRTECEYVNRGFTTVRMEGRPWVTIKMAMDRAGRISNDDGSPLKITSKEQDVWSHTWLRSRHDAILVGVQTVIADDPSLNTRFAQNKEFSIPSGLKKIVISSLNNKMIQKEPLRIILDPQLRTPTEAKVCDTSLQPTLLCVSSASFTQDAAKRKGLESRGVLVKEIDVDARGGFVWESLWHALLTPSGDYHGITSILVEGGLKTWRAFSERDVDEQVKLTGP